MLENFIINQLGLKMPKKSENPSSIEKALRIIRLLANHYEGLGTIEISEQLGLSTSTASRMLILLAKEDFVRKNPVGKKYVLGNTILEIGRFYQRHLGSQLIPISRPYIDALRDTVEESAILEIMTNEGMVILYRASGPNVISVSVKAGTIVPLHISPGARAILAFSPPEVVDRYLKIELPKYTAKTITDREKLKKSFKEIREKGVAFASGEYNIELNSMGAPVFNREKKPIAAVVVTMPRYRAKLHKKEDLVSYVKETASKISKQVVKYKI